ncbi:hypothetical protein AMECASPLE_028529 [Ameca splendens]|uniref:Uncharacterized protein n=1 Tax=Ameca splendens TaxID=208324 RepID=A0ABV0ZR25_9TELE
MIIRLQSALSALIGVQDLPLISWTPAGSSKLSSGEFIWLLPCDFFYPNWLEIHPSMHCLNLFILAQYIATGGYLQQSLGKMRVYPEQVTNPSQGNIETT